MRRALVPVESIVAGQAPPELGGGSEEGPGIVDHANPSHDVQYVRVPVMRAVSVSSLNKVKKNKDRFTMPLFLFATNGMSVRTARS
jgi:hypothetical protein